MSAFFRTVGAGFLLSSVACAYGMATNTQNDWGLCFAAMAGALLIGGFSLLMLSCE